MSIAFFIRRYNIHHQKIRLDMTPLFYRWLQIAVIGLFFTACGVYRETVVSPSPSLLPSEDAEEPVLRVYSADEAVMNVQDKLFSAHHHWRGTPYVLGGSSTRGVDCSAFTQIVYRDFFGLNLPRHTRDQLREGSGIRRNHIRPGDLIFFRTGKNTLHVGIAMQDGDFLHASVSSGVMISNVGEKYWASRYLGARRIMN
jgi:hypothetical protein